MQSICCTDRERERELQQMSFFPHHQKCRSTPYLMWQVCYPKFPRSLFHINLLYDKSPFFKEHSNANAVFPSPAAVQIPSKYHTCLNIWGLTSMSSDDHIHTILISDLLAYSMSLPPKTFFHYFRSFIGVSIIPHFTQQDNFSIHNTVRMQARCM